MPDTAANQAEYPQTSQSKPGAGFPIARLGVISSLSSGAVLDLGFCPYAGKGTGEVTLLQRLWGVLAEGDVLLTDCKLGSGSTIVTLQQRGIDFVSRMNRAQRCADFRLGQRLGKEDHVVRWPKPQFDPLDGLADATALAARLADGPRARIPITTPGFRTKADHPRHDAARPEAVPQGRPGRAVPGALEPRARPAVDQDDDADGRAALQDARAGPQGGVDPPAGVQPDPDRDGPSRREARRGAADAQLQGSDPDARSLPAADSNGSAHVLDHDASTSTKSC